MSESGKPQRRIKHVERALWNLFTDYTISSDPLHPGLMKIATFISVLKDCRLLGLDRIKRGDMDLAVAAQLKRSRDIGGSAASTFKVTRNRMNKINQGRNTIGTNAAKATREASAKRVNRNCLTFTDFLEVLRSLAPQIYPKSPPDEAWKRLFLEDILVAHLRPIKTERRDNIAMDLNDDRKTFELIHRFAYALGQIFEHYSGQYDIGARKHEIAAFGRRRNQTASPQHSRGSMIGRDIIIDLCNTPDKVSDTGSVKVPSNSAFLRYTEYIEFLQDFQLAKILSLTDCARAYIRNAMEYTSRDEANPDVDEPGFHRILINLAVCWSESTIDCKPTIPVCSRLKALMLYMWKSLQVQRRRAIEALHPENANSLLIRGSGETNLFGAALFDKTFKSLWEEDKYCNYFEDGVGQDKNSRRSVISPSFSTVGELGQNESNLSDAISPQNSEFEDDSAGISHLKTLSSDNDEPDSSKKQLDNKNDDDETITLRTSDLKALFICEPAISDVIAKCIQVSKEEEKSRSPEKIASPSKHKSANTNVLQLATLLAEANAAGLSSPEVEQAKELVAIAVGLKPADELIALPKSYW